MSKSTQEQRAYSKGYRAGLRAAKNANVKNERASLIAAHTMAALIQNPWGYTVDGKHKPWDWLEIQKRSAQAAENITNQMEVY